MNKWVGGLIAASALLLSGGVMAQGYVSFAGGQSKHVDTCAGFSGSCDDSGTAVKVVAGYASEQGLGLEFGYLDFGKATASGSVLGYGFTADIKVSAFTVGGAFKGNFTPNFAGHMRLGIASVKAKGTGRSVIYNYSASETKAKPYYGFGLSYAFSPELALEAGADFSEVELDGGKNDVRALTVGLRISF